MLFNEPKLLKYRDKPNLPTDRRRFSALQRAEIAEIRLSLKSSALSRPCFSALQRAEIAEIRLDAALFRLATRFSALQRAEIAEIEHLPTVTSAGSRFSALQRAEIAEIEENIRRGGRRGKFQCSSTSRNC